MERIRNVRMKLNESKEKEGWEGRGEVGREAQASVSLRFIFVFRK